jgi:Domain of unknown function (DUF4410)
MRLRFAVITVFVGVSLGVHAQKPVKSIEDGVLDRIDLFVAALDAPSQLTVGLRLFDASTASLGTGDKEGKDARQQEAQTMQREGPRALATAFATEAGKGPFRSVSVLESEPDVAPGLLVEGRFVELNPGSRAKRYFVGFGAGKSSVKVAGTVKDAGGKTLASFEQRRIGTMGMGGGDSLGKLMADSRNIGEDIGRFLVKWARGEDLD